MPPRNRRYAVGRTLPNFACGVTRLQRPPLVQKLMNENLIALLQERGGANR